MNRMRISIVTRATLAILRILSALIAAATLAACSRGGPGTLGTGTPIPAATATTISTATSAPAAPTATPTPGALEPSATDDRPEVAFTDPELGLSMRLPPSWQMDASPGAVTHFYEQEPTGAREAGREAVMTLSVLATDSSTLELALEEVRTGAWGPYLLDVVMVQLGEFEALRLEMSPGQDRPQTSWLLVAPSGRAVGITPAVDPSRVEAVLATLQLATVPSGLVYRSGSGLWRTNADAAPTLLLEHGNAVISADGDWALFGEEGEVWIIELST